MRQAERDEVIRLNRRKNDLIQEGFAVAHELLDLIRPILERGEDDAQELVDLLQEDDSDVVRFFAYNTLLNHQKRP